MHRKSRLLGGAGLLFAVQVAAAAPAEVVRVADFGAAAGDGQEDAPAIHRAILHARSIQQPRRGSAGTGAEESRPVAVLFDEGVYTLADSEGREAMLHLDGAEQITLRGARRADGSPATILQVHLALRNDAAARRHIDIHKSRTVTVENIIMDHSPRFNTAGQIVDVDRTERRLVVEMFDGTPHFDGMKCYSANTWDLQTGDLIPVGVLTQGAAIAKHEYRWQPVAGTKKNRYRLDDCDFVDRVEVGQGMSWHFNAGVPDGTPVGSNVRVYESRDVTFRNVRIYSTIISSLFAAYNENLAFENFRIEPTPPSLAVGPRDGMHLSKNTGRLLIDNIYIKGVRWDPVVVRLAFAQVAEVQGRRIRCVVNSLRDAAGIERSSHVTFFAGKEPFEQRIASVERGDRPTEFWINFLEPLPGSVVAGTRFTPSAWNFQEAVIRNSRFEGNHGTAIVYQSDNLLVENNLFRNNAYSNIGLGPTSKGAGGFARNIIIRGNQFIASTWLSKSGDGTISSDNKHPGFRSEPYNTNLLIEDNLFQDLNVGERVAAIHLSNAQKVVVRGNRYINVNQRFKPEPRSTANIALLEGDTEDAAAGAAKQPRPPPPRVLWYRQPARHWVEALPIGNGQHGAMGGYEVDLQWKDGRLVSASLHSLAGEPAQVRYLDEVRTIAGASGQIYRWERRNE